MAEKQKAEETTVSFKDTLNLPHTDFPIRAHTKVDDPAMIARWEKEQLFETSFTHNKGNTKFILHDGPPYANGNIHIGHAYNKILKDIVTKSQRMMKNHVPVTPGWDCHGLPIELKVTQEKPGLSRSELKKACRAYAQHWIEVQKEEFKRLGVLMDWDHPYLTMSFSYEASILRAFGEFVAGGYIERKNKTVPWCASCQTVLATAEIEYEDRKDPSIYVLFPLEQAVVAKALPQLVGKTVSLLVWTTTPWTLPLNRAVQIKPGARYVVLDINNNYVLVGEQLADAVCALMNVEKKVITTVTAEQLEAYGPRVHHPFIPGLVVPVLLSASVQLDEGTACVHCAPGAGPEDYEFGVKHNLEIFSPVDERGKYTSAVEPTELVGMSVADGNIWVIKKLAELKKLLFKNTIKHAYPHCWRCHQGLIFRATKQWFCDLEKNNLKERTLQAIDTIATVPEKSSNRLKATVEGRLEWCLSRQRIWGVPITALLCTSCDYTYISKEFIDRIAKEVEKKGIEYWDDVAVDIVLPKGFSCPVCKGTEFKKEQDILDVWFDSGVSHYAVLKQNPALAFPANMYLEGKDQHRGWFQSSLLTSMVLEQEPCMKTIVTHGFTVDEQGRKMSKSLGNSISPEQMIEKLGTDGLRLWVSSIDCSGEVVVSDKLLTNVQEVFRKIRNTCRFLISNLYDFDIKKDAVSLDQLRMIDQYALQELYELQHKIIHAYAMYDFTAVFHLLGDYCSVNLSAFYLDISKDRLYVESPTGHARRSAQTVYWYIVDTLTKLMAPILSFTAEQISDHYQKDKKQSIHLQSFNDLRSIWELLAKNYAYLKPEIDAQQYIGGMTKTMISLEQQAFLGALEDRWQVIKNIRSAILKSIEEQREKGIIKHSLEAKVTIFINSTAPWKSVFDTFGKELVEHKETIESFFKELLIVSQCTIAQKQGTLPSSILEGLYIEVQHADGDKCPRCWQWEVTDNEYKLCARCQEVVKKKRV